MSRLKVFWGFMPIEIRESVEPILDTYLFLIPPWVSRLYVDYWAVHEKGEQVNGSADTSPEYRHAYLHVHASWLAQNPWERRHTILHELSHVLTLLPGDWAFKMIERTYSEAEAPLLRATLTEELRFRVEAANEDLTLALMELNADALPRREHEDLEDEAPSRPGETERGQLV